MGSVRHFDAARLHHQRLLAEAARDLLAATAKASPATSRARSVTLVARTLLSLALSAIIDIGPR